MTVVAGAADAGDAGAQATDAQVEEQQRVAGGDGLPTPSEAALDQAKADAKWREENPGKALIREGNPEVGGESFDYLDKVRA